MGTYKQGSTIDLKNGRYENMKPSERIDDLLDHGSTFEVAVKITLNEMSELAKPLDATDYITKHTEPDLFERDYDKLKKSYDTLLTHYKDMQVLYLEQTKKELALNSEIEKLNAELFRMRK